MKKKPANNSEFGFPALFGLSKENNLKFLIYIVLIILVPRVMTLALKDLSTGGVLFETFTTGIFIFIGHIFIKKTGKILLSLITCVTFGSLVNYYTLIGSDFAIYSVSKYFFSFVLLFVFWAINVDYSKNFLIKLIVGWLAANIMLLGLHLLPIAVPVVNEKFSAFAHSLIELAFSSIVFIAISAIGYFSLDIGGYLENDQ